MGIVEKFIKEGQLTKEEYPELLHLYQDPDSVRLLREEAVRIQKKYFGNKIYTRGLIEFTNYCKNDCYYCGIRKSNTNAKRYRLTEDEIMAGIRERIEHNDVPNAFKGTPIVLVTASLMAIAFCGFAGLV